MAEGTDAFRSELDARRLAVVLEHVAAENARDVDRALRTFEHPRYEIVPTGLVYDGADAVRSMLLEQWSAMPPVTYTPVSVYFGDEGIMVETRTTGTRGDGSAIEMTSVNLFGFRRDKLVLERCYFDQVTVAQQIGFAAQTG
jgi:ketosteroid isomerase-like protein